MKSLLAGSIQGFKKSNHMYVLHESAMKLTVAYLTGAIALTEPFFGRGNASILTTNVRCTGDEELLDQCVHSSLLLEAVSNYQNYSVAGVICQGNTTSSQHECTSGDLRLVGGERESEGRVEICVEGFWGTVCNNTYIGWGQQELAVVACRQKGFTSGMDTMHTLS